MTHASLPVVAALVALFVAEGGGAPRLGTVSALVWILATLWTPPLAFYGLGWIVRRRTRDDLDRRQTWVVRMRRLHVVVELLIVAVFVLHTIYGELVGLAEHLGGWIPLVDVRRMLAAVPVVVALLLGRTAIHEVQREDGTRHTGFISFQLKLLALPLTPLLLFVILDDLFAFAPLEWRVFVVSYPSLTYIVPLVLIVAAYVNAPRLIRLLWRTTPLRDHDLLARVREISDRHGIAYGRVSVAFSRGLRIANAGVAGLLPRSREIFVTDRLLHRLDNDEVEGVLAHELGHIKHGHMWLYLAFSVTYFGVYLLVFGAIAHWAPEVLAGSALSLWVLIVGFFYAYFVLLFGVLSRAFERQADLFAVQNIREPESFPRALAVLGEIHSLPTRARRILDWTGTHPSISRRIEFTTRAIEDGREVHGRRDARLLAGGITLSVPIVVVALLLLRGTLLASGPDAAIARAVVLLDHAEAIASDLDTLSGHADDDAVRQRGADLIARARHDLADVLRVVPDDADALYLYGLTGLFAEKWDSAEDALMQALDVDPHHFGAIYATALLAEHQGDWDRALDMIDRARRLRPGDPKVAQLRARLDDPPSVHARSSSERHRR